MLLIGVSGSAGCGVLGALLIPVLGAPELVRREAGAAQCQGKACDRERWVPVLVRANSVWPVAPWQVCVQTYQVEFASGFRRTPDAEENLIVSASVRADDLTLAAATGQGSLALARFASPSADTQLELGAVAVAWSSDGQRLAVVARDASEGQASAHRLLIFTPDLEPLFELTLDLPLPDEGSDYWHFIVSWTPDDSALAVSTDGTVSARSGLRNEVVLPRCHLVRLSDSRVDTFELYNVYFIAPDTVLATVPPPGTNETRLTAGRVFRLVLSERRIEQQTPLSSDVRYVLASHPPSGVFASLERDPQGTLAVSSVGLHTLELGPDIIFGNSALAAETLCLVPLDVALPVLEATGFGPDDVVLPDPETGGCPE